MYTMNPSYEKPKNYIRFDVSKSGCSIIGVVTRQRGVFQVAITWQATQLDLSLAQAQEYAAKLDRVAQWAQANGADEKGKYWEPGKVVERVEGLSITRLMFHNDDSRFVRVSRKKLAFGLYSKPVFEVDGGSGNMIDALQASTSLKQLFTDMRAWGA